VESEPNGSAACAQQLSAPSLVAGHVSGTYSANDEDWYRIPDAPGGMIWAHTTPNCTGDTVIELMSAAGTVLAYNDDASPSLCSDLTAATLPAGAAYLRVRGFNATYSGVYTLTYVSSTGACNGHDQLACSQVVSRFSTTPGSLAAGEQDWYTFRIDIPGQVTVKTSTSNCALETSDTVLTVRSESAEVALNDDSLAGSLCSLVTFYAPVGRYFVKVAPYTNRTVPSYTVTIS
jgi:hypothetical protein